MIDYYSILGVSKTASSEQIKKRAFLCHNKHTIAEAYAVLSDDSKRARYDLGEDVQSKAPNVSAIAIQNIQTYFLDYLQEDFKMQDFFGKTEQGYLLRIRTRVIKEKSNMKSHAKTLKKTLKYFTDKQDKVFRKDKQPDAIFEGALNYTIRRLRADRSNLALGLASTRKALQILKKYEEKISGDDGFKVFFPYSTNQYTARTVTNIS